MIEPGDEGPVAIATGPLFFATISSLESLIDW